MRTDSAIGIVLDISNTHHGSNLEDVLVTRVTRRAGEPDWLDEVTRKAAQWAPLKATSATTIKRVDTLRNSLKTLVIKHGTKDANGHLIVTLPEPIDAGDETITSLKAERHVHPTLDEEKVREVLEEKGLYEQILSQEVITYIDQDKLYALQQRGGITEEELDSMWGEKVTFHLKGQK